MPKIKRSELITYVNVTPESPAILESLTATYALLGEGVVSGKIGYGAKTTDEVDIAEDSGTKSIDSYGPTIPIEQTAVQGDGVFDFVDQLRIDRAVLGDAETDIVNVEAYETAISPGVYPAEQQKVAIVVGDFGGDGGSPIKINFGINYIGDPVRGTFLVSSGTFTAT